MPLADRAGNILALLEADGLGKRPIIYVCHSLGGLVVKQMMRTAEGHGSAKWQEIGRRTAGLVFLSTPHAGARLANYLDGLGRLLGLRPTAAVGDLEHSAAALRDLNTWFRNHVSSRDIPVRAFFEKRDTKGVRVVDEVSADPGLVGSPPIAIDADHFAICKPASRNALVHKSVLRFLEDIFDGPAESEALESAAPSMAGPTVAGRPARFFISYRRSATPDNELVGLLKEAITRAGHEVFIDVAMPVGVDWVKSIEEAIAQCDFLVPLLSADALHSEMVLGEIRLAHRRRVEHGQPGILPVRVAFDGPLDYELSSYLHRINYVSWRSPDDKARVVQALIATATPATTAPQLDRSGMVRGPSPSATSAGPAACDIDPMAPPRPRPQIDLGSLVSTTGSMKPGDPAYVRRACDDVIDRLTARSDGITAVLMAPRQMGKSSLLQRFSAGAAARDKAIAAVDFQLDETVLSDLPTLLAHVARQVRRRLKLPRADLSGIRAPSDLTEYFEDEILAALTKPLVLAFDEADQILAQPYGTTFFAMIRAWHNHRADDTLPWSKVDIALVVATEPFLFIPDPSQSPFNVGELVHLPRFDDQQCAEFNTMHGQPLSDGQLRELVEETGGQPYLVREAFYQMARAGGIGFDTLLATAADGDGPFGHHLKHLLMKLRDGKLVEAMRQVIHQCTVPGNDEMVYERLKGGGLVRRVDGRIVPANRLYARFFRQTL